MKISARLAIALVAVLALVAAGCGDDDSASSSEDLPTGAVTTNILGDVVEQMAGEYVNVVTIMPVGADPHDFQASAQQVTEISNAAAVIVKGGDFEEGLIDVIESAEADGVPVYEAMSTVSTIEYGEGGGHDDHGDEHDDHGDEDHDDHGDEHKDEDHDDHDHDDHGDEEQDHDGQEENNDES